MIIKSLASSSRGNCYLISDGVSTLMIECGIKLSEIRKHTKLTELDGCLISHEHKDHSKYVKEIAKYCEIYASKGTLESIDLGTYSYRSTVLEPMKRTKIRTFTVVGYLGYHKNSDDTPCEVMMFHIYSTETKKQLLFATDTGVINYYFNDLDYLLIECNYSLDILKQKVSDNILNKREFERLLKSHLGLEELKKYLSKINLTKMKAIYLLHLSDRNSDAKRFKKEIQEITGKVVYVCDS